MDNSVKIAHGADAQKRPMSHLAAHREGGTSRRVSSAAADVGRRTSTNDIDGVHKSITNRRTPSVHYLGSELDCGHTSANGHHTANMTHEPSTSRGPYLTNIFIDYHDENGTSTCQGGAFFNDGRRRVDFVLVYEQSPHHSSSDSFGQHDPDDKEHQRAYFERNLIEAGLNLEEDTEHHDPDPNPRSTVFVKIHAPLEILCVQAEKLNLKLPLKLTDPYSDGPAEDEGEEEAESIFVQFFRCLKNFLFIFYKRSLSATGVVVDLNAATAPNGNLANGKAGGSKEVPAKNRITWPFSRKRIELFDSGEDPSSTFFTPTQRLEIVWNMLQQARNDPQDEKRRGIERLLETDVYEKAFALHDGKCTHRGGSKPTFGCQREKLRHIWASWRCVFRRQPLGLIRSYFGEKAGFYFAFLGFYTKMLVWPAIFGVCAVLYGFFNPYDDVIVRDICDGTSPPGNFIMCPLCQPPHCHFTQFSDGCDNAKWDYRMDNEATLVVACLTVIWSICMLKLWKRREAELAFQWDTFDVEQEDLVIRPEYEERAPTKRRNPVTKEMEPYVPPMTKARWVLASCCITLFVICLVGVTLALLILARIALYGAFSNIVHENVECVRWFVHGLIFIVVFIFEKVYHEVAHKLTSLECPRTQEAWLSSFLWKVFVFQLLNDFVPIAYAAWVKGRIIRTPLDLSWHTELCDTGGCMAEVTELTAVLLLMRLVVGNAAEVGWPLAKNFYKRFVERRQDVSLTTASADNGNGTEGADTRNTNRKTRWHADYLLNEPELDGVAEEYLEMMIQFAFCTLFLPAFPLAPLVCLLNNIVEIRVDAINFVRATRRLIPIRVAGIQIWNEFLSIISKLAIIFNAGLIAFTSTIVPRLYYKYVFSPEGTYENYTLFSVSKIHQSAWRKEEVKHAFDHHNVTECYYEDYRQSEPPYSRVQHWWEVECIRLAAFATFALLGFAFEWGFNFVLDDTPRHVVLSIQRRRYFVTKAMEAYDENWDKRRGSALRRFVETSVYAGPSDGNDE